MHVLAKKILPNSGDRDRRREIVQEPLQPLLAQTVHYPCLRFLQEGKRLRQHLLSLRGESDLPLAATRSDLDLNESLHGERMQILKPSTVEHPSHDVALSHGKARHRSPAAVTASRHLSKMFVTV